MTIESFSLDSLHIFFNPQMMQREFYLKDISEIKNEIKNTIIKVLKRDMRAPNSQYGR